jgi:glycosyltransferase involved in cell wall biosynthesis
MNPKISVVIPSYNRAHYIEKTIDSVLEQKRDDIEIILVDDGSTDNTRELVQNKYGDQVKYVYQENQGIPGARNTGIKNAQGDYIAFLDSDDCWLPGKLERQMSLAEEHPEYGLLASRCVKIQNAGHIKKPNRPLSYQSRRGKSGWVLIDLFRANFIRTSSVIIRRDCFDKVGLFDEKQKQAQDYDLWLRMAAEYQVGFINEALTVYLDNPKGISGDSLIGRLYRLHAIEKSYLKKKIPEKLYNLRIAQNYFVLGRHYLQRGDREKGLAALKKARRMVPLNLKYTVYFVKGLFTRHKATFNYNI